MKAESVKIKEFKVIKNLEQEIKGRNILLVGDNGVGKSSFIQFLEIALGKQTNIPADVSGGGEVVFSKNGNDIKVSVDFKDGKPIIKIRGNGISIDNKKGAIYELFGALDFDVDEFVDLSKTKSGQKEQVEKFKSFLSAETRAELAKFEANVKNAFEERADLNRDIKKLEGSVSLHPLLNHIHELDKFKEVSVDSIMNELKIVQAKNQKITGFKGTVDNLQNEQDRIEKEVNELEARLTELKNKHKDNAEKLLSGHQWLKDNQIAGTETLETRLTEASDENKKFDQAQQLIKDIAKIEELKSESGELTAQIESSREAIEIAIRDMDGPIEGLAFDDEKLLYNGVPVTPDNLSTSEIMELGIRLKMAENPELGILFIQRGESLGADRLKTIQEIADKAGWQIIMEQVERGKKELHVEIMEG